MFQKIGVFDLLVLQKIKKFKKYSGIRNPYLDLQFFLDEVLVRFNSDRFRL